jgi:hypothetical protein
MPSPPESADPKVQESPTARQVGPRALRIALLWVGMVTFFIVLWNWVGPGSLK